MDTLVPLAGIAMIVLIVWTANLTRQKESKRRAALIGQLIDKFSTGEEFAKAMQGPKGRRLAQTLSLEHDKSRQLWVGLFVAGTVLACLGLAFFALAAIDDNDFVIPAFIVSSIGAALLVSALVTRRAEGKDDNSGDGRDKGHSSSDDFRNDGTDLP